MALSVTLVGSNDRQLEDLLQASGYRSLSLPVADLAALAQPSAHQPDVLVLDLREQTTLPPALALLKRQHPTTGVVIVASTLDPALILAAMRAGVNECVTEPVTRADLDAAIARVAVRQTGAAPGQVIAFVGAKGGVGATTVAINVATALARVATSGALLVDLHLSYGDAAVYLGAEPRFSVLDALENTHRLDEAFFRSLIVRGAGGLDVLASSDRPMTGAVDGERIRALIDFTSRHFEYTILDVPRTEPAVLDALDPAKWVVVVANQELAAVRSAGRLATTLRQRYGKDRVTAVVSRYDSLAEIRADDIEEVLGGPVRHIFPSDYRLALSALNKGRPLVLENHNKLAHSFTGFARALAGLPRQTSDPDRPPGLLGRLTGRR